MKKLLKGALLNIVAFCLVLGVTPAFAQGMSAYIDVQVQSMGGVNSSPDFRIPNGAIYLFHSGDNGGYYVDIPLATLTTMAGLANPTTGVVAGASDLTDAQFYANYKYDMGLGWKLGKFDSVYGFEKNDTKDVFFATQGNLHSNLLNTHTGLELDYGFSDSMGVKLLVANANAAIARGGDNLEYGFQFNYVNSFKVSLGGTLHKSAATAQTGYLIDILFGMKMGKLALDLEFDLIKATALGAQSAFGVMGNFIYAMSDKVSLGARIEFLSKLNDFAGNAHNSQILATLGPNVKMTDNLTAKVNYTFNSTTTVSGGASGTSHAGVIAAVYAL